MSNPAGNGSCDRLAHIRANRSHDPEVKGDYLTTPNEMTFTRSARKSLVTYVTLNETT